MKECCDLDHDRAARVVSPAVRIHQHDMGAYVVGLVFDVAGNAAAGLGDNTLRIFPDIRVELPGMPLAVASDVGDSGFVVGDASGQVSRVAPDGKVISVGAFPRGWAEQVVCHRPTGRIAAAAGRTVKIFDKDGNETGTIEGHPSAVTGLAFVTEGNRLAVSRYNGVSIWGLDDLVAPQELVWKGSHTAVSWSPNGRFIVSATQERDMHCWDLAMNRDMKMSGYSSKVRGMSWSADSLRLAAAGAEIITVWDFDGSGPQGKPPIEVGYVFNGVVTTVAMHPVLEAVAGGYSDGTVLIGDIRTGDAIIARAPDGAVVSALVWSPDGARLLAGTENGALTEIEVVGKLTGRKNDAERAFIERPVNDDSHILPALTGCPLD